MTSNLQLRRFSQWCLVSHGHDMLPRDDGAWVRYDDVRAEIERLQEEYRNCDEQRSRASDMCDELRAALEQIAKPSVRGLVRSTNDLEHIAREALRGVVETSPVLPCDKCGRGVDEHVGIGMPCPETTPNLNCPTCGELYTGRGGQRGLPVMLTCPNGHTWADPRGGCNS